MIISWSPSSISGFFGSTRTRTQTFPGAQREEEPDGRALSGGEAPPPGKGARHKFRAPQAPARGTGQNGRKGTYRGEQGGRKAVQNGGGTGVHSIRTSGFKLRMCGRAKPAAITPAFFHEGAIKNIGQLTFGGFSRVFVYFRGVVNEVYFLEPVISRL